MDCEGGLYWPARRILAVSDLHLEKGSSFAERGYFVPPYDTHETLGRLLALVEKHAPSTLILLGDSFHDDRGYARLNPDDRLILHHILKAQKTVWVLGNHDKGFVPEGVEGVEDIAFGGIVFRHEAGGEAGYEISGHYHPVASLTHKGMKIRGKCFLASARRMMLPSFGSYTGGLEMSDPAISRVMGGDFRVHMCAQSRIFSLDLAIFRN